MGGRRSAILLGALLLGSSCGPRVLVDDAGDMGDEDGTTSDTPPVPGTSTSPPPPATVSSTSDPTAPPPPLGGTCRQACQDARECCGGADATECPGPFPNNWTCQDGACFHGGCTNDLECANWAGEGLVCADSFFGFWCMPECSAFDDCEFFRGWSCSGVSAGGTPYCTVDAPCSEEWGDVCEGQGTCDPSTGTCQCSDDAECEIPGWICHRG